ncbi:hypothetical protein FDB30_04165 [Clostridium botulinum]|uniref:Uncharacterized protein n=1 Tax=Clostridium botulinum TaxID=1491 RepID=A0A846JVS5_CLOBO|nr:hypothetical protein [Clostridium botulinum]KAI3346232.1 hypothetical protein CIT18_14420 [Clostridium botulinum]KOM88847.1 hypothetical protein ACP51_06375 [Clostridium botulinum]KOR57684.1 hypothetical protein ADT22_13065 [Clostridium botulinum]NFE13016.1 hypothetical protein [Clostridium botulinum]NFE85640.1 hypothetical protein [Clostridium botulinum]
MENNIFEDIKRVMDNNFKSGINEAMFSNSLVLGTITTTGLKLDDFKHEITDYMLLDYLKLNDNCNTENTTCTSSHSHEIRTPENLKSIKAGNRVLVARIGNECIVIGRVMSNA